MLSEVLPVPEIPNFRFVYLIKLDFDEIKRHYYTMMVGRILLMTRSSDNITCIIFLVLIFA